MAKGSGGQGSPTNKNTTSVVTNTTTSIGDITSPINQDVVSFLKALTGSADHLVSTSGKVATDIITGGAYGSALALEGGETGGAYAVGGGIRGGELALTGGGYAVGGGVRGGELALTGGIVGASAGLEGVKIGADLVQGVGDSYNQLIGGADNVFSTAVGVGERVFTGALEFSRDLLGTSDDYPLALLNTSADVSKSLFDVAGTTGRDVLNATTGTVRDILNAGLAALTVQQLTGGKNGPEPVAAEADRDWTLQILIAATAVIGLAIAFKK